ncbi:MAG: folate-binding protein [Chromatiaceae bacterium]
MNTQWKDHLLSQTAEIDGAGNVRFPAAPSVADPALMDLSRLGLIAVGGADATQFLQGQLTNDLRTLTPTRTQLSAHCSPKGRMLANFRVLRFGELIYLQLPRSAAGALFKRLSMFVLRAQVTVEDASDRLVSIGLAGPCAPDVLATLFPDLPEDANAIAHHGELVVIRIPGTPPRFEVLGPVDAVIPLWDGLARESTIVDADYWALLDIRAGLPTVYPQTADLFIPQMTNMQLIDGVSFTKGCYTGQEVVARMQYLGRLKRRMYVAEVHADEPPQPGEDLFSRSSTSEQATGWVVDARRSGPSRCELLAVVEIAAAESQDVRLGDSGPPLTLRDPPYGFAA